LETVEHTSLVGLAKNVRCVHVLQHKGRGDSRPLVDLVGAVSIPDLLEEVGDSSLAVLEELGNLGFRSDVLGHKLLDELPSLRIGKVRVGQSQLLHESLFLLARHPTFHPDMTYVLLDLLSESPVDGPPRVVPVTRDTVGLCLHSTRPIV
jgi:hypothetical protein